jgi:hypothetical protein
MCRIQPPCVGYAVPPGCRHVKTNAPVMLGGWADIIRIHAMGHPAGADGRILIDKSFCSKWSSWCFVIIKTFIHFFVC